MEPPVQDLDLGPPAQDQDTEAPARVLDLGPLPASLHTLPLLAMQ